MENEFYRAHIDITGKCNLRCIHCYASEKYNDQIKTEDLFRILKQLKTLGIQRIALSGGEPLLRPELWDIIEMAPNDISILTNAHLITDEFIKKVINFEKKGKIFTIRISLDGIESYKKVRLVSPDRVIKNIKKLVSNEIIVVINTTIMPFHSIKEIIQLYRLLLSLKVDQWNIDIPFLEGSAKENSIQTSPKKYADIVVEIAKLYQKERPEMLFDSVGLFTSKMLDPDYEPRFFNDNEHPCSYQFHTITIDAQGKIKFCPSMEYNFGTIWDYDKLSEYRKTKKWKEYTNISIQNLKKCQTCKYRGICGGGCRANVAYKNIMDVDTLSCYLMERFEKDIIPLLPTKVAQKYLNNIKQHT